MIRVIDPAALTFASGPYGSCINGQTFQQEALLTCGDHQYATWYAGDGSVAVGRRRLPDGAWETLRLPGYRIQTSDDAHNTASLGICAADGSLHLAFDHHNHPLHYRRSRAGVTTQPERHAWSADLFGAVSDQLEPGRPLAKLCYPCFVQTPDGGLQLLYRLGSSGNGDWHLAEYAADSGWRQLGLLLSRAGTYQGSAKRCAYPNPLRYADDGALHLTWSWREPGKLDTNHDLLHAVSRDRGRTWLNGAGTTIADLAAGRPIHLDSPGILAVAMPYRWGQMNTTTQAVDRQGRVHVVCWCNPRDAAGPSLDMNAWIYLHCWRDGSGIWHEQRLPFAGRKPQIACDADGALWLVSHDGPQRNYPGVDPGGRLRLSRAAAASGWTDWRHQELPVPTVIGEPLLDPVRWRRDGVLSIYVQTQPAAAGQPSALLALEPPLG